MNENQNPNEIPNEIPAVMPNPYANPNNDDEAPATQVVEDPFYNDEDGEQVEIEDDPSTDYDE